MRPKRPTPPTVTLTRLDPTRTTTLRRAFGAEVVRPWAQLKGDVLALCGEDPFGLAEPTPLTFNKRWQFRTSPQKVEAFRQWLRTQMGTRLRGKSNEEVWRAYVERAFRQGQSRARADARRKRGSPSPPPSSFESFPPGTVMLAPVSVERVEALVSRVLTELDGVTAAVETRAVRVLADGMARGQSPREVAKALAAEVEVGKTRAEMIARTETIRAHAEGQLDELERQGVVEVGVEVEWVSTQDKRRCKKCEEMAGTVLSVKKARGLIPLHPNCRCAWVPHFGAAFERKVQRLTAVKQAVKRATKSPKKKPPTVKKRPVRNVFCPTGPGGASTARRA